MSLTQLAWAATGRLNGGERLIIRNPEIKGDVEVFEVS
jgi:hypothetical protein